ncbi:MAG: threonine synthase, partial [Chloroflexota bacterium]|nr:threonine synthase [Chloroflexota bacterium]
IGTPSEGAEVVRLARETGGVVASVTEEERVEGIELLAATEGIFAETAGGVTVAVLRNLARAGRWQGDETVVAYITGAGLKTAECVASRVETPVPVQASLRAVRERYAGLI